MTPIRTITKSITSAVEGAPLLIVDGHSFYPFRIEVRYSRSGTGTWRLDDAAVFGGDNDLKNIYEIGTEWRWTQNQPSTPEDILLQDKLPEWALTFIVDNLPKD